ncbi:Diaminobutyrate--2-oxoglutarate transaminase [Rubripirellula lacrimiformis]|uniref:Diaminobutyrate--2-oxoglutarate transaminase n=2 Tax=Rubripirellula lacrimiformis TaxID=1930273 RepID=A0A517NHN0_9BACT|nr:Diaminobutyrate--2-oxoglutarate transaminase [Rubripirellula lacrimiformis]
MTDQIEHIESNVRGYAKLFPTVFDTAIGSTLCDQSGKTFIDFFCGAGTLNYGHNHAGAKEALLRYISRNGIQHSLDTVTTAKIDFLTAFENTILKPRQLDYVVQFTGPTGTNAVEAAIKLAKKRTGRSHIVAFTNAYHGHTLGSLALTGNRYFHNDLYGSHNDVTHLPFDRYLGDFDTSAILAKMLSDSSSGLPLPAAVILETVQGEGGINVASTQWLRKIAELCTANDILLIIDDIQVGNGRTGKFFSFEESGIHPDIVCLSKSIGGGLPMSLVLIRRDDDVWQPGEHTGTFRGNNLAFVAATAVLKHWDDPHFESQIETRSRVIQAWLTETCQRYSSQSFDRRGRGLIWGLDVRCGKLARQIIDRSFDAGLLIEASGADDQVLKLLPALTIEMPLLVEGLNILDRAIAASIQPANSTAANSTVLTPHFPAPAFSGLLSESAASGTTRS